MNLKKKEKKKESGQVAGKRSGMPLKTIYSRVTSFKATLLSNFLISNVLNRDFTT